MSADKVKAAKENLASLGRVSHRLAMVDTTDRLEQVLDKLLPRLLKRIGENHREQQTADATLKGVCDQIHAKLVEMMSHVIKRVRNDTACKLPCEAILLQLLAEGGDADALPTPSTTVHPMTMHLSLTFLTIGVPRCTASQLYGLLPNLIACQSVQLGNVSRRSQCHQMAHLLLRCLETLSREGANEKKSQPNVATKSMELSRRILCQNDLLGATIFELFLDVLLYQPTPPSSSLPPDGLSQAGNERLKEGNSTTAKDWPAEMAPRGRLVRLQLALLELVSPSRHWALFLDDTCRPRGLARTLALLVVASGNTASKEVSDRASSFVKMHFDSFRGKAENKGTKGGVSIATGDTVGLVCTLLSLCMGQNSSASSTEGALGSYLGRSKPDSTTNLSPQLLLSMKRRPLSDSYSSSILSFVSSKVLENEPRIFDNFSPSIQQMTQLAVQVAKRVLGSTALISSSGLTQLRAKPYSNATQLLSILSVRLCAHFDSAASTSEAEQVLEIDLLNQIFKISCDVLTPASSSHRGQTSSSISSEGNVAIRDSCYEVVSTLCRSKFASLRSGFIFQAGEQSMEDAAAGGKTPTISVSTASLLFGCASNEEERLKPRAVAALDSLLASYCRTYHSLTEQASQSTAAKASAQPENPWAANATPIVEEKAEDTLSMQTRSKLLSSLLPLVWTAGQSYQPKPSRVAAARWASELLYDLEEGHACHLLCFLAGDSDPTTAGIALQGLSISDDLSGSGYDSLAKDSKSKKLPDFGKFVSLLFEDTRQPQDTGFRSHFFLDFSFRGKAVTLYFSMGCLLNDFYGGSDKAVTVLCDSLTTLLASFLEMGAKSIPSKDLLDECASSLAELLDASKHARELFLRSDTFGPKDLQQLVFNVSSSRARKNLAKACSILLVDLDVWTSLSAGDWLEDIFSSCTKGLQGFSSGRASSLTNVHGSIYLGAYAIQALRALKDEGLQTSNLYQSAASIMEHLGEGCLHEDEIVGNACSDGIVIALHSDGYDCMQLHAELVPSCALVLEKLATANAKFSEGDNMNTMRTLKATSASGVALSATTSPDKSTVPEQRLLSLHAARRHCANTLVNVLGSSAFRKEEEVAIGAGQALSLYSDAFNDGGRHTISHWPDSYDEALSEQMPPSEEVLYMLLRKTFASSSPPKKTSTAPALLALVARAAKNVNQDQSYRERSFVKSVLGHLEEIQSVFITLLSHPKSKHLTRESCCLGLAACRGLQSGQNNSAEELNNNLLRAFGQTTSFSGSALMETTAQALERRAANEESSRMEVEGSQEPQVEVGGASGIGEAALGAFREMASAAVALGRHDILYPLLILSVSHTFWFTVENRQLYSASALLGDNAVVGGKHAVQLKTVLRPYLGKLLPRILRAKHDPNAQTREQMTTLWTALTGGGSEARASVTDHLLSSVDELTKDTGNRLWRVRVGACSALAEIIVGRDWDALGGGEAVLDDDDLHGPSRITAGIRLLRLWRISMRALDDVRITVRESGAVLARAVRALTIRLCDPSAKDGDTGTKRDRNGDSKSLSETTAASATALRWLVRHGLNQHSEGTAFCITCLVDIVGLVTPVMLSPILPDLLRSLLVSISGLEPAALNYLQLRTNDQEGLERARLQLASSGPIASAVTKCLDLTPSTPIETQQSVVVELDSALRQSAGFATRAATADAINTLCSSCPAAFRFPSANSSNPTVRLLRAIYHASERERTGVSRDRLVHAFGSLASVSPGVSVRSIALKACQKYASSTGSNDDPAARTAAAACLRSIAVRASNQLNDGGGSDIWCKRVLPNAFIGRKDENTKISALWQDVWEEASSALKSTESELIGTSPEENLLPFLIHECVLGLADVSWTRRSAASRALTELCHVGVLAPLTSAKLIGDSALQRNFQRSECSKLALTKSLDVLKKPRLWTGKNILVETVSNIAGAWVSTVVDDSKIDENFTPLTVTSSSVDDLFPGDQWFANRTSVAADEDEEDKVVETIADRSQDADKLTSDEDSVGETQHEETNVKMTPAENLPIEVGPPTFPGLCRLLLESATSLPGKGSESSNDALPYRKACFDSLKRLLSSIPVEQRALQLRTYETIAPSLIEMIGKKDSKEAPVLFAAALDCLATAMYDQFGMEGSSTSLDDLVKLIAEAGGEKQVAWTVRESSGNCLARVATVCNAEAYRKYAIVSQWIESANYALTDRKFWRVRVAGLNLLHSLVKRAADDRHKTDGIVLEALLPHKESLIVKVRSCLKDSEARVTATATEILSAMAWWP